MTAIEFYRLTEETLNNLAKAYDIKNLEEYNKLTDVISLKNTNFKNLSEIEQVFAQIAFHGQNGTLISNPDSNTAFFCADVAVSPFTAGSHSTTCNSTLSGKITPKISPSNIEMFTLSVGFIKFISQVKRDLGISI